MEKFHGKYRIPSSRWQNWDYGSNAAYYVTICTRHHACCFGEISLSPEKTMQYTPLGSIAYQYWTEIPTHFPFVDLDAFVIMPNHVHGIVVINKPGTVVNNNVGSDANVETQNFASLHAFNNRPTEQNSVNKFGSQSQNLASIIRGYKTGVKKYATTHHIDFSWQPRFHDRVIRDHNEYTAISDYINNNIEKWESDDLYKTM
jgi:REP element-mobilizing transposase RayT